MKRHSRSCGVLLWALVASATLVAPSGAAPAPDPLAECRQRFADAPDDYESSYCFVLVIRKLQLWDDGARVFESLIAAHPQNFWLPMAFGHVYRTSDVERARALYLRAADGFRKAGHAEGEILARSNLRNFLFPLGRTEEAGRELQRVMEIGASVSDPILKARAWMLEATHVQDTGGDYGVAYRLLKQVQGAVFPKGPYRLKQNCLLWLSLVASNMGRFDEALAIYADLDAIATTEGDGETQAVARYNILNVTAMKEYLLPMPGAMDRLMRLADRSLASGTSAQHQLVMLRTHRTIAELLANTPASRPQALEHMERCLDLAAKAHQPYDEAACAWVEAWLLRTSDRERSQAAEKRALEATARANSPSTQAHSAGRHMRLSWETKPRAQAIRDALAALDAVETLRGLQEEADSSAALFSAWTFDYYWLSGRLLQEGEAGDLPTAFEITERMRARSLLDALERSRTPLDQKNPAVEKRREILRAIAAVQRGLMDPTLGETARRSSLERLDELERQEKEAQRQVAIASPLGHRAVPAFASLETVQAALAPNEALLSFQIGNWETYERDFGGGSWLVVLTRERRSVHRLPGRTELAEMIPVFTGLIARADGLEAASAVRLYQALLADALHGLPPGIERLIVVPDGALHHLPFDTLRAARDAPPLAARYELVVAPSSTLLLHWRTGAPAKATKRALAFADPALQTAGRSNATVRNAVFGEGLRLGRLPFARRESRAIERHLGSVEAVIGDQASEHALKARDLRAYDVVHFAAHAVADEARPERSAVLLCAGADTEDGLLQAREIAELDLEGRVVVLSACQTAAGTFLIGEGVLSLARAFFEAGAHAVIGSRWPIRDEDAAAFFDIFYRGLAEGATLAGALKQAKVETMASGRPAAAWASVVLLGNGDLRLTAPVTSSASHGYWPITAALLGLGIPAAIIAVRTFQRSRHRRQTSM